MKKYLLLLLVSMLVQHSYSKGPCPPCDIVSGLSATNITNTSAALKWSALPAANYDVDYKATISGVWINIASAITATSRNITGMSANTIYDWRVRAHCIDGAGNYANAQFTTGAPVNICLCPGAPSPSGKYNYDTVLTNGGISWNAKIHLPWDYYSNTNSYQAIVFFPGIGEIGTDISKLLVYGPHKYLTAGWNGNVKVDSDSVKFIIISLQPLNYYPDESLIHPKLATIKLLYRVKPGGLHLTGLSHGGWCASTFVTGDPYGGPYTYASQIASVVDVEGVQPGDNQPYPDLWDNFALIGGRLLCFEQTQDFRDMQTRVNRMNATVANSAIYRSTSFGNAGHCCFDNFYGSATTPPGIFNLDGRNENIYQWMARQ